MKGDRKAAVLILEVVSWLGAEAEAEEGHC
jgi:hypothetical protein